MTLIRKELCQQLSFDASRCCSSASRRADRPSRRNTCTKSAAWAAASATYSKISSAADFLLLRTEVPTDPLRARRSATIWKYHLKLRYSVRKPKSALRITKSAIPVTVAEALQELKAKPVLPVRERGRSGGARDFLRCSKPVRLAAERERSSTIPVRYVTERACRKKIK